MASEMGKLRNKAENTGRAIYSERQKFTKVKSPGYLAVKTHVPDLSF